MKNKLEPWSLAYNLAEITKCSNLHTQLSDSKMHGYGVLGITFGARRLKASPFT